MKYLVFFIILIPYITFGQGVAHHKTVGNRQSWDTIKTTQIFSQIILPKWKDINANTDSINSVIYDNGVLYIFDSASNDWVAVGGGGTGVFTWNGRSGSVVPLTGDYTFAQIGSKPTTVAGYGITDAYTKAQSDARYLQNIAQGWGISVSGNSVSLDSLTAFTYFRAHMGLITSGVWLGTAIADLYIESSANWNNAYNNYVTSGSWNSGTGNLTFTKNNLGTWSVNLDGRYLTTNQSITWTASGDASGSASGTTSISPSLTINGLKGVSIPALSSGFLKYNGTSWLFDASTYLTGNQTITITPSGDISGSASGATSITPVYTVTGVMGKSVPSLSSGFFKYSGSAWTFDNSTYLTGNQTITITPSGDISGSGSGATSISPVYTVTGVMGKSVPTLATGFFKYSGTAWQFDNTSYVPTSRNVSINGVSNNLASDITYTITSDSGASNVTTLTPYSVAGKYMISYTDSSLTGAITINNPVGTWQHLETLVIFLKSASAQTITPCSKCKAGGGATDPVMPTSTTAGKRMMLQYSRDTYTDTWWLTGVITGLLW